MHLALTVTIADLDSVGQDLLRRSSASHGLLPDTATQYVDPENLSP
jgi:hypothetical protein